MAHAAAGVKDAGRIVALGLIEREDFVMQIDLATASPWADFHRIISNASSMAIVADGKKFSGAATVEIDDFGNVTMTVGKAKGVKKK